MGKNMSRLAAQSIVFAGMIGITAVAFGENKKISEAEACDMAKAEVLTRKGGENKRELTVTSCGKFSTLDIGVASIQVVYDSSYYNEYMKMRYETKNLADMCRFIQNSQGWKLIQCK
jgi:hypothetical protein